MSALDTIEKWLDELTPGTFMSRRGWAEIIYTPKGESKSKDISQSLMPFMLSVDYTDNMMGQVDDINITLEDKAQLWQDAWYPEPGSKVAVTLYVMNKDNLSSGLEELYAGQFEIDEIEVNAMPSTVQVKGVSAASGGSLRGEKKNRTWENISIWKCASDIAEGNGLELGWYCDDNPNIDHVEQSDESDLEFLSKVVKDAGFCLKIDAKKVIIFDEQKQEEGDAAITFLRPGTLQEENTKLVDSFISYRLTAKTRDIYKACHVRYKSGKDAQIIEATFTAPDKKDGKTLEVNEQVKTVEEAERLVKKKLREKNKDEVQASFSLTGDFAYSAGMLVKLKNFGRFDGKYIITRAHHKMGSGYTCQLDLRRCLNGY